MKTGLLAVSALLAVSSLFAADPRIDRVEPFHLKTQQSGSVTIKVMGDFPLATESHPDRSEYEHWFIHRGDEGGAWECKPHGDKCALGNWSRTQQELTISSEFLHMPGTLEIRMNEGFVGNGMYSGYATVSLPIVDAISGPPVIVSVTPISATAVRIAANNFDATTMVDFRGDTLVKPDRIVGGTTIEVTIPPKYRSTTVELSLRIRTDRGGYSNDGYFKPYKPPVPPTPVAPVGRIAVIQTINPKGSPNTTTATPSSGVTVSADTILANRLREALTARLGAAYVNTLTIVATKGAVKISGPDASKKNDVLAIAANVSGVVTATWSDK